MCVRRADSFAVAERTRATTTTLRLENTQAPPRQRRDCRFLIVTIEKRPRRASDAYDFCSLPRSTTTLGSCATNKQHTHDTRTTLAQQEPNHAKLKLFNLRCFEFRFDFELTSFRQEFAFVFARNFN